MATKPKVSKVHLLGLIDELQRNPNDKVRVLGEVGIVSIGASTYPLASAAAIVGVKAVFGLSAAAHCFGWLPALFWTGPGLPILVGYASVMGLLPYGLARMVRGCGAAEGHKAAHPGKYRIQVKEIDAAEQSATVTEADRTQFILSLRTLIDADAIPTDSAFRMIEMVEAGRMPLAQPMAMAQACRTSKSPQ